MARQSSRQVQRLMVGQPARAFGAGHGGPPHDYKFDQSPAQNTQYKRPSQHDVEYQLPSRNIMSERVSAWINGRWQVDRDDQLDNTTYNKYSAYHVFGTQSM